MILDFWFLLCYNQFIQIIYFAYLYAVVAELADALGSGPSGRKSS